MSKINISKIKEIIKKAIVVLEDNGWTKEFAAKDADGKFVIPLDPSAVSFCAYGAVIKATQDLTPADTLESLDSFVTKNRVYESSPMWKRPLFAFNDSCENKEEVIQLFKDFLVSLEDSANGRK